MNSPLEEALLAQILEAGLPAPRTQFSFSSPRLRTPNRNLPRTWRFDFAWDLYRLAVEVDGGTLTRPRRIGGQWLQLVSGHNSGAGIESDREKDCEALRAGWTVLRVTKRMVESGYALAVIGDLIAQNRARLSRREG